MKIGILKGDCSAAMFVVVVILFCIHVVCIFMLSCFQFFIRTLLCLKITMSSRKKIQYLIVDTSAFIKNTQLQEIGENIITVPQVVNEIKSKRQLQRLVVLPYDLVVKDTFPEHVKFVTEFSKKTGDYPALSATDIQVIALTYQLEKEQVGTEHLKKAPNHDRIIRPRGALSVDAKETVGFFYPEDMRQSDRIFEYPAWCDSVYGDFETETEDYIGLEDVNFDEFLINVDKNEENENSEDVDVNNDESHDNDDGNSDRITSPCIEEIKVEDVNSDEVLIKVDKNEENENSRDEDVNNDESHDNDDGNSDQITSPCIEEIKVESVNEGGNDGNDNDLDDDDNSGWITPSNIKEIKMKSANELEEPEHITVACLTTDFAMQNVLKQIGLNVVSLDGKLIKELRTYILRCYGCFKTTSIMTKVFCPNCGNKTLKRVGVTIEPDGTQTLHINFKKPLTSRGKKFSVPKFEGGKHPCNPILFEDQPMPQQHVSRVARMKKNPLDDDYIAGYSPFATRDVTSKSAMLGLRPNMEIKQWMRKNPNVNRPHSKKNKKK